MKESAARMLRSKLFALFCLMVLILAVFIYLAYDPAQELYGRVVSHGNTKAHVVALTFDDGPNGDATLQVLKILKDKSVPATFFLVGENVQYYPRISLQIVQDGNEVENHSLHHQRVLTWENEAAIVRQLTEANQIIEQATGQRPIYFRPPYGFRTPWAIRAAQKAGFTIITWNNLTGDFRSSVTAKRIIASAMARVHPGAIIDLHDGTGTAHDTNRQVLIDALPQLIDRLKAEGYSFVTLRQMLGVDPGVPQGAK